MMTTDMRRNPPVIVEDLTEMKYKFKLPDTFGDNFVLKALLNNRFVKISDFLNYLRRFI